MGDVVVNIILCWQGAIGLSKWEGVTSPAYDVYKATSSQVNVDYFNYLFRLPQFSNECYKIGRGIMAMRWRTYSDEFKAITVPLPTKEEQDQIVRYLDWKVSQTNKLINAKRQQIALLREKRQKVINETFLSDGEGWIEKPLKYWVKSNLRSIGAGFSGDSMIEYLDIGAVGRGFLKSSPSRFLYSAAPSRARRLVEEGDTIISTVRTYLRSTCYVDESIAHCVVSTGFSVLTPDRSTILPELLGFAVTTDSFIDEVICNSIGASYPAINDSLLMTIKVQFPASLKEQGILFNLLRGKLVEIDAFVARLECEITLINEYRTRLISDVVTGKKDVRDEFIPQYETIDVNIENIAESGFDEGVVG